MNSYDARAGLKLGFTAAGTAIGGPIGGAIGSAVGTLAGALIPTKTFIKEKTSFNENVDQNMSYSRADYGKGFLNYTSQEREKATSFSKIADTAADAIPMVAGAAGFKGLSKFKFPSLGGKTDALTEADKVISTGNEVTAEIGTAVKNNTMKKVFDYGTKSIGTINDMVDLFGNKNAVQDTPSKEQTQNSVPPLQTNFDAIDFDSSVNGIMKSIGDSPFKPIDSYKETFSLPRNSFVPSSVVNDYLPNATNLMFTYTPENTNDYSSKVNSFDLNTPEVSNISKLKMKESAIKYPSLKSRNTSASGYAFEAYEKAKTKEEKDAVYSAYKKQYPFTIPNENNGINPVDKAPIDLKNVDFDKEIELYKKNNKNAKYYMY